MPPTLPLISLLDGVEGETSDTPRQLKEQEIAEWILLDGVRSLVNLSCNHRTHIA